MYNDFLHFGKAKIEDIEKYIDDARSGKLLDPQTFEPYKEKVEVDLGETWKIAAEGLATHLDNILQQISDRYHSKVDFTTEPKEVMKWILADADIQYRPIQPDLTRSELSEDTWLILDKEHPNFSQANEYRLTPDWIKAKNPYEAHQLWQIKHGNKLSRLENEEAAFVAGTVYNNYHTIKGN